uniref:Uncharacterized protein n=1 Tax=Fagus sylvatica TaxID=28930 RepID=A0A2N9IH42_FAGSY
MIAQGVQDDHLNDAFMERVWVESGHDINMEHDEDEDTDIERFIINGGVGDDDDDDDNVLDDDHGDQEYSTHGFPPMEAPSPSFIANTRDNIIVPSDIDEVTGLTVWKVGMELSKGRSIASSQIAPQTSCYSTTTVRRALSRTFPSPELDNQRPLLVTVTGKFQNPNLHYC